VEQRFSSPWDLLAATRFVLALLVLGGHLVPPSFTAAWWTALAMYFNPLSAVFGFLLISGYSIAASLDQNEQGFFWRRARRIYPTYLVSLGFTAWMMGAGVLAREPASRFLFTALMLQTFVGPAVIADGQLWSLATEWWNYLLAPIYRRVLDIGLIALVVLSLAIFLVLGATSRAAWTTGGFEFATISWFWISGFLYYRRRRTVYGYALLFLPLAVAANFGWIGLSVWLGAVALAVCEDVRLADWLRPAFRWLGDLSYPLYAIHGPILGIGIVWGVRSPAAIALASLIAGIVILHVVDLPSRRLRLPSMVLWRARRAAAVEL
jgi:peptidoglycan/LPS O-acetylase OafA/YrhL